MVVPLDTFVQGLWIRHRNKRWLHFNWMRTPRQVFESVLVGVHVPLVPPDLLFVPFNYWVVVVAVRELVW